MGAKLTTALSFVGGLGATVVGGLGATAVGGLTFDPVLMGLGVMGMVSGTVAGISSEIADNAQNKAERNAAAQQRVAGELKAAAENRHQSFLNTVKGGAMGATKAAQMAQFAKAIAAGNTVQGARIVAGLTPGHGTAQEKMMTRAIDKHFTGGSGLAVATAFGDPLHRSTALAKKTMHSGLKGFMEADRMAKTHEVYQQTMGGGSQTQATQGAPSGTGYTGYQAESGPTGAGRSYESRIAGGQIQAQRSGTYSAVST